MASVIESILILANGLSGGIKTLILFQFNKDKIFNASTSGDTSAKWLLKIAESEDRTVTANKELKGLDSIYDYRSTREYNRTV